MGKRSRWASSSRIRLLPNAAPRIIRLVCPTLDVRRYSDAGATDGGLAAVAFFARRGDDFTVLLQDVAEDVLIRSVLQAHEICGLEMFADVAAGVAPSENLSGDTVVLFIDDNAAAGVLFGVSPRLLGVLALIASCWGSAAQLSATCCVEGASSEANAADAPNRTRPLFTKPRATGALASFQTAVQLRLVLRGPEKSSTTSI